MDAAVGLVKAYLEQCGYFVLTELPLREPVGDGYRDVTDVDIIAVRFPHDPVGVGHHRDPLDMLLGVDPKLEIFQDGVDVIIAEVKAGRARRAAEILLKMVFEDGFFHADPGYTYQLSLLQLEVSRTEVFDRPLHGRQFFEEVIKDHIDLGRPEQMQLVFGRRVHRRRGAPPPRTRIFTQEVNPSLLVAHRNTKVKQYWKGNRALRTETTFNDSYDFEIGRKLRNLATLIAIGIGINRRLLELERQSCRATPAASIFEALVMPTGQPGRRAPGLRFGDPRVVALFSALSNFRTIFGGFYAKQLRPLIAQHLGRPYSMRQAAYDLRRLIRKGLLEWLPRCNRYRLTSLGQQLILFTTKLYHRVFCRPRPPPAGLSAWTTQPSLARIRSGIRSPHPRCSDCRMISSAKTRLVRRSVSG